MTRRTISAALLVLIIAALAVFSFVFVRTFFYFPDEEIPAPADAAIERALDPSQYPMRLAIPVIGIDADVQEVGVNAEGNMATPDTFDDVGWYKYGPVPGGRGSAVIAGHVNNGLGLDGVFARLGELEVGDDIYVEAANGARVHFVVMSMRSYPYDDSPVDVIFNPHGSVRLNLITCEGRWVAEDKTYDQRLVVFARPAEE